MLKAEQIPDEVVNAYKQHIEDNSRTTYRDALAAAINAWPGMVERHYPNDPTKAPAFILPLTQDPRDE